MTQRELVITNAPTFDEVMAAFRNDKTLLVKVIRPDTKAEGALALVVTKLETVFDVYNPSQSVIEVRGGVMYENDQSFLLKYSYGTEVLDPSITVIVPRDNDGGPDSWNYNSMGG